MTLHDIPWPYVCFITDSILLYVIHFQLGYQTGILRSFTFSTSKEEEHLFLKLRTELMILSCVSIVGYVSCFIWVLLSELPQGKELPVFVLMGAFLIFIALLCTSYYFGSEKHETNPYNWTAKNERKKNERNNHAF